MNEIYFSIDFLGIAVISIGIILVAYKTILFDSIVIIDNFDNEEVF